MNTKEMLKKAITKTIEQGIPCGIQTDDGRFNCFYTYEKDGKTIHCAAGQVLEIPTHEKEIELFGDNVPIDCDKAINFLKEKLGREVEWEEIRYLNEIQQAHDDNADSPDFIEGFKDSIEYSVGCDLLPKYCLEFIA